MSATVQEVQTTLYKCSCGRTYDRKAQAESCCSCESCGEASDALSGESRCPKCERRARAKSLRETIKRRESALASWEREAADRCERMRSEIAGLRAELGALSAK